MGSIGSTLDPLKREGGREGVGEGVLPNSHPATCYRSQPEHHHELYQDFGPWLPKLQTDRSCLWQPYTHVAQAQCMLNLQGMQDML